MEFLFASLIGLSLGLLGGGGSTLTVPVLVYLVGMEAKLAIAMSLAIVGFTSLFGVFTHFKSGNINKASIVLFAPMAMIGAYLGSYLSTYISGQVQLILFGVILLVSSTLMIRGRKESDQVHTVNKTLLIVSGLFVGVLSGVIGVGGGFLIVPALVILANLPMKQAIGSSLVVITLSSLTGFVGHLGHQEIPWVFLAKFTSFSAIGILIGSYLVRFISQAKLKKGFGVFLIFMGIFILYKNTL